MIVSRDEDLDSISLQDRLQYFVMTIYPNAMCRRAGNFTFPIRQYIQPNPMTAHPDRRAYVARHFLATPSGRSS